MGSGSSSPGPLGQAAGNAVRGAENWAKGGIKDLWSTADDLTNAPTSPDYMGAAEKTGQSSQANVNAQTMANRPNQSTDFASSEWAQNPDGSWTQNSRLRGGLGDAATALQGQAGRDLSTPMDWSQFGKLDDGSAARDQAIKASYDQSTSRLNPQWDQRNQQMQSGLANQGLDPNSQAARNASLQFNQGRNDAYGSAMNSAIHDGRDAQTATFNQNMMARQQAIAEALRQRGQSTDELKNLQGFLGQADFHGAGQAAPTNYSGAADNQGQWDDNKWKTMMGFGQGVLNGGMNAAGQIGNGVMGAASGAAGAIPSIMELLPMLGAL